MQDATARRRRRRTDARTQARTRMDETALRAGVAHQAALHRLFTTWWYFGCFREPAPDDALDVGENQAH